MTLGARPMTATGVRRPPISLPPLPKWEQGIIKGLAQTYAAKFEGSLQDSMAEFGRIRFTIERHGEKLITVEQW